MVNQSSRILLSWSWLPPRGRGNEHVYFQVVIPVMKEKCDKGLEVGMRVWEEAGSYFGKACLKLFFFPTKYENTLYFNQEASDSKFKALGVYKTFVHATSLHLAPNLRISVILPFYRGGNRGSVRLRVALSY